MANIIGTNDPENLFGTSDADVLDGLGGDDLLIGGGGNDIYVFGRGYGQDIAYDYDLTPGNFDIVRFTSDVLPSDIGITRDGPYGSSLVLTILDTGESIRLDGWFWDSNRIEQIEFADGTLWDTAAIESVLVIAPATMGDDSINGFTGDDVLSGLEGNDVLFGFGGNDTLDGGSGDDVIAGDTGDDLIIGGTGNDLLYAYYGNDTLLFARGDGQDTISGVSFTSNDFTTIRFTDVPSSEIVVTRGLSDLRFENVVTGDRITFLNWFDYSIGYGATPIDRVEFADGTVWDGSAVIESLVTVLPGTSGTDDIGGTAGNDTLQGFDGDDSLYGFVGNDTYEGGIGNDYMQDRTGDETYIFGLGDGQDLIEDESGNDTILFGPGIVPGDILVSTSGYDLVLTIANTTDSLTLSSAFDSIDFVIERAQFSDGSIRFITADGLLLNDPNTATEGSDVLNGTSGSEVLNGLGGDDTVNGYGGNDVLIGGAGNDVLNGYEGDDTLTGGAGNDTLNGGDGNDVYVFNLGDGVDTINEAWIGSWNNEIRFGAGIASNSLSFKVEGTSLITYVGNTGDAIYLSGFDSNGTFENYAISTYLFEDGSNFYGDELWRNYGFDIYGTASDDTIVGTYLSDRIYGLGGNDILDGRGNDGWPDYMEGGSGDDVYYLDYDDVVVENLNEGNDTVYSYASGVILADNVENLVLLDYAYTGYGNELDNVITGSADDNFLDGGAGNDTYIYNYGGGLDTISDLDGLGTILYRDALGTEYMLNGGARAATSSDDVYYGQQGRFVYDFNVAANILTVTLDGQTALTIQNYDQVTETLGIGLRTNNAPEIHITSPTDAIRLVSVAADGTQANNYSSLPSISADGRYVAFTSYADNLVAGDTNGTDDIFVKDLQTGAIVRANTAADGTETNGDISSVLSISADGRYVAFRSDASNLVVGDTNGTYDIFVKDLQTGAISRANTAADGTEANGTSRQVSISADGRYVAFASRASNLVAGDTNGVQDIFVKDLQTGLVTRASIAADGTEANGTSRQVSISADGRYVVFESGADNLVPGGTNLSFGIFVKDLQTDNIVRADTAVDGTEANDYGGDQISISSNGRYVAFTSYASNLVAGDTNNDLDVFVKDLQTGAVTRASVAADGRQVSEYYGNYFGESLAISADGRYVAFYSGAVNLVPDDTNDTGDIFVKDIQTGAIARVSVAADGTEANDYSDEYGLSISADGRYISFASYASNLVSGDTNPDSDIFLALNPFAPSVITNTDTPVVLNDISVSDVDAGTTPLAIALSVANGSLALQGTAGITFTDADGSDGTLAFSGLLADLNAALAAGIVYTPDNGYAGEDTLSLVVDDQSPDLALNDSANILISILPAFGYTPGPDNLTGTAGPDTLIGGAGNDTLAGGLGNDALIGGTGDDTYIFNLGDGVDTINDISLAGEGNTLQFGTGIAPTAPVLSYEGNYLVLNLGGGDQVRLSNFSNTDVYGAHAVETFSFADGTVLTYSQLIDRGFDLVGTAGDDVITDTNGVDRIAGGDGNDTYVVNNAGDVVVENLNAGTDSVLSSISHVLGSNVENLTLTGAGGLSGTGNNLDNVLTGNDGANTLTGGTGNDTLDGGIGNDTYIYNFGDGTDTITDADGLGSILYRDALGTEYVLNGGVRSPTGSIYYDEQGRFEYVLDEATNTLTVTLDGQAALTIQNYDSVADSLGLALDVNQAPVIQIGGSLLEPIRLVSTSADGTQANNYSYLPALASAMSSDGRYVAFESEASNLVVGDTNGTNDIFVKDLQTGAIVRTSTAADGTEADGWSQNFSISTDGRYVSFESEASNLVLDDTNGIFDIFVKDLQTGAITRVSTAADGSGGDGESYDPSISADGRYVTFISGASNLVVGDMNGTADIFVKDLQTGAVSRVNTAEDGSVANDYSLGPLISANGRYVSFTSYASNLVADDTNDTTDVFVKDLQTGIVTHASTAADGTQANGYSSGSIVSAISADGRYVVFNSGATNLVPDGTNVFGGLFVKDLQTGAIALASTAADGTLANGYSQYSSISADGRYVTFLSDAFNLVSEDTNGTEDIFVKDLQTGAIARVNDAPNGIAPISADGRYVTFVSNASDLVAGDTNNVSDVFIAPNPLFPAPSVITNADTPVVLNDISVSDVDAGTMPLGITLSVINGSLALQDATGITFTDADGSDGTLAFSGLLSDLNAAFTAGILYTPDAGYSGDDALDLTVNDQVYGAALTDNATIGITILPPSGPTPGPDNLSGTAGADTLTGGTGNDTLSGGAGSDTYIFNLGDGVDTINDLSATGEGNALQFGTGIDPAVMTLSYDGGVLVLNLGGGDQIRLSNFSNTDVYGNHAVETFTFADGTVLTYSQLIDRGFDLIGTAGDDVIQGTNGVDRIVGGDGNDTINGGGGNDILSGGLGDDTYNFDAGNGNDTVYDNAGENNTLVFGPGVDPNSVTLNLGSLFINIGNGEGIHLENFDPNDAFGSSIIQTFVFDDGTTLDLASLLALGFDINGTDQDDALTGTSVTDRITGGLGNDSLDGGAGDDTYYYNQGDGLDTLTDSSGLDTITLGTGFSFDSTIVRTDGNTAHLRFLDTDGNETNEGMDIALNGDGTSPIESFTFEDGTTYSLNDLLVTTQTITGTKKADTLIGDRSDDTIYAGKSGDSVYGRTGNDTLYGEKGNDKLYGEGGNDSLHGGKGKDLLDGGAGNDLLDGGEGKNTLIGGKGNDTILLGKGEDTIRFNQGDGWDTLKSTTKDPEDSEIEFGAGITQQNLWFSRTGNDLTINILGTDDGMTVENWFTNKHKPIEEFETSNGYELEDKQVQRLVQAMASFTPTPGSGGVLPTEMPDQLQATLAAAWESD